MIRAAFLIALLAFAGCGNIDQIDNINKEDIDAEIDEETQGLAT